MCDNSPISIKLKNPSDGNHKVAAMIKEFLKPEEPLYYEKMVYLKNNWKDLTKDYKTLQVSWPSFDVYELPVIWK